MADTTTTTSKIPEKLTEVYNELKAQMLAETPTIQNNALSAGTLRNQLAQALRPQYDTAIKQRQTQTAADKASLDADAAARGLGSSSWLTDVKNRQSNAEASDIASLNSGYSSTLATNLLGKLSEQESNRLATEQYNASMKGNAIQNAWHTAMDKYAAWNPGATGGVNYGSGSSEQGNAGSGFWRDGAWYDSYADFLKSSAASEPVDKAFGTGTGGGSTTAGGSTTVTVPAYSDYLKNKILEYGANKVGGTPPSPPTVPTTKFIIPTPSRPKKNK